MLLSVNFLSWTLRSKLKGNKQNQKKKTFRSERLPDRNGILRSQTFSFRSTTLHVKPVLDSRINLNLEYGAFRNHELLHFPWHQNIILNFQFFSRFSLCRIKYRDISGLSTTEENSVKDVLIYKRKTIRHTVCLVKIVW